MQQELQTVTYSLHRELRRRAASSKTLVPQFAAFELILVDSIARRVYNRVVALLVIWQNERMTSKWRIAAYIRKTFFAVGKGGET